MIHDSVNPSSPLPSSSHWSDITPLPLPPYMIQGVAAWESSFTLSQANPAHTTTTKTAAGSAPIILTKQSAPPLDFPARFVACGGSHSCVIDANLGVQVWGSNRSGQLGIGDASISYLSEPTKLSFFDGKGVCAVALGERHSCVVTLHGVLYVFGSMASNTSANLGVDPLKSGLRVGLGGGGQVGWAE